MSSIIAINQRYLNDARIANVLPQSRDIEMLCHFSNLPNESRVPYLGLMPRTGVNNLPFRNDAIKLIGADMPRYDPDFNMTWDEITDHRAMEIEKMINCQDRDLVVQWSGGIDSTCILSAIIKNFSRSSKQRVKISCNWGSIIEHPKFYRDYIENNFETVDINQHTQQRDDRCLIVGGEIADKISMTACNLDQNMGVRHGDFFVAPWRKNKDQMIQYISSVTDSDDFAKWFFRKIEENIESVDVPVETCFDFLWWASFNYHWYGSVFLEWLHHHRNHVMTWEQHEKNFLRWYETEKYQQWSMTHGAGIKYGNRIDSIKQPAKQYIFDLDRNSWYRDYKIKVSSAGRIGIHDGSKPFAITDDFRLLDFDRDLEPILEMLPAHLGQS